MKDLKQTFGDLGTDAGLKKLDEFLSDRAYLANRSFEPTTVDVNAFKMIGNELKLEKFENVARWWRNIKSYKDNFDKMREGKL